MLKLNEFLRDIIANQAILLFTKILHILFKEIVHMHKTNHLDLYTSRYQLVDTRTGLYIDIIQTSI